MSLQNLLNETLLGLEQYHIQYSLAFGTFHHVGAVMNYDITTCLQKGSGIISAENYWQTYALLIVGEEDEHIASFYHIMGEESTLVESSNADLVQDILHHIRTTRDEIVYRNFDLLIHYEHVEQLPLWRVHMFLSLFYTAQDLNKT